jgi:hypothetical protein
MLASVGTAPDGVKPVAIIFRVKVTGRSARLKAAALPAATQALRLQAREQSQGIVAIDRLQIVL